MSTFQLIMIALGVLFAGSAFWDQIKGVLGNLKPVPKPTPQPGPVAPVVIEDNGGHRHECDDDSLCSLVVCWENLRDELNERGLYVAEQEVEKIFPLFVKDSQPLPQPAPPVPVAPVAPVAPATPVEPAPAPAPNQPKG